MIFLNVILKSSILFACETYYNLTEAQIRQLERIEEGFIRKLLKTSTGCPIVQLYLETGHIPARFAIKKAKLLFLKTILEESEKSLIHRFLSLQFKNPTKNDWASGCMQDMKDLEINLTLEEIKKISKYQFSRIIKESIQTKALKYLLDKQRIKGSEIDYKELKMAEYLLPNEQIENIDDQRKIFSIRNKMVEISANFSRNKQNKIIKTCVCGTTESMDYIVNREVLNKRTNHEKISFEAIYSNNIKEQLKVSKQFFHNFEQKDKHDTIVTHEIHLCDPPSPVKGVAMDCK